MSTSPPTPSQCRGCQKLLDAPPHTSGLCEECLRATDLTIETAPQVPPPEELFRPLDPTATFDPSPETAPFRATAPEPIARSSRMERLLARGWLEVRPLGVGGMGALYVGYDPGRQLMVVAKFILPHELRDGTRSRFGVEAAALARLSHPNVARLFEYRDGDDPYLVLEYIDGGSLADRLRRTGPPLTCREAAELLEGTARGVAAAHRAQVIHRDLKPGNLLLDTRGPAVVTKVTDFGMAKDASAHESLTVGDATIGTPEYMSPEQAGGHSRDCTARSDVWGLGATLYAAVTGGVPPFARDVRNPPVLRQPLTPPEVHRPDLPADLAAVIRKALEKHPDDRYRTADEFADDLKRFLDGRPVTACPRAWPVRAWRRARRMPRTTAVAVVLAVAAAAVGAMVRPLSDNTRREPTPDERMAGLMANLADRKPVTIIGERELPVWQRPLIGSPVINQPPNAGGDLAMTDFGTGILALTPPLPVPYYTAEVELRDVVGVSVLGKRAGVPHHHFGIIIGLTEHEHVVTDPADTPPVTERLVSGCEFRLCDFDRDSGLGRKTVDEYATFGFATYRTAPPPLVLVNDYGLGSFPFTPKRVAGKPGPWRKVVVAVTPAGVTVSWREDDGRMAAKVVKTPADFDRASSDTAQVLQGQKARPVAVPRWPFRGGVGLLCYRATVAVKNLVLTPQ